MSGMQTFVRFVGDAYMRPVPFARDVAVAVRSRAGQCPAPTVWYIFVATQSRDGSAFPAGL